MSILPSTQLPKFINKMNEMIFFHLYIRYSLYVVQVQKSSMVVIYVDFSRLELCAAIGALEQFKLYLADR